MLLQKGAREDAIHALINTWIKDPRKSCGWCGASYIPLSPQCCDKPFIATNAEILSQFNTEIMAVRESQLNDYGSNKSKNLRLALSFPPGLLEFLTKSFQSLYQEDLINEKYNLAWFAKKFGKYFAVPKKI